MHEFIARDCTGFMESMVSLLVCEQHGKLMSVLNLLKLAEGLDSIWCVFLRTVRLALHDLWGFPEAWPVACLADGHKVLVESTIPVWVWYHAIRVCLHERCQTMASLWDVLEACTYVS
jgi:hypothetical protein